MVRSGRPDTQFAPGDRVAVPWGLDVLEGTVVEIHGEGPGRRVVVSVELPDTGGESAAELVTLPVNVLEHAAEVADDRQPGAWLSSYRYEQELRRALESLAQTETGLSTWSLDHHLADIPDSRVDFIMDVGAHRLIIEAKAPVSGRVSEMAVRQILRYLKASRGAVGLLVTNVDLSPEALTRLQEANREGYDIHAIQWRSQEDTPRLGRAIKELLSTA